MPFPYQIVVNVSRLKAAHDIYLLVGGVHLAFVYILFMLAIFTVFLSFAVLMLIFVIFGNAWYDRGMNHLHQLRKLRQIYLLFHFMLRLVENKLILFVSFIQSNNFYNLSKIDKYKNRFLFFYIFFLKVYIFENFIIKFFTK